MRYILPLLFAIVCSVGYADTVTVGRRGINSTGSGLCRRTSRSPTIRGMETRARGVSVAREREGPAFFAALPLPVIGLRFPAVGATDFHRASDSGYYGLV